MGLRLQSGNVARHDNTSAKNSKCTEISGETCRACQGSETLEGGAEKVSSQKAVPSSSQSAAMQNREPVKPSQTRRSLS